MHMLNPSLSADLLQNEIIVSTGLSVKAAGRL